MLDFPISCKCFNEKTDRQAHTEIKLMYTHPLLPERLVTTFFLLWKSPRWIERQIY